VNLNASKIILVCFLFASVQIVGVIRGKWYHRFFD